MKIALSCFAAVILVPPAATCGADTSARPNIVLIFADDFGYGDAGCYGGTLVPTPAIDSLARDGVLCTDGYVTAPVCAPSRCGLMTGAYNQRFGMQWNDDRRKYTLGEHQLLPQALRAAGYLTSHIGKWNIPVDARACFDEAYDLIDWEADYFPDANGHYHGVDSETEFASSKVQGVWGPERPDDEYLTDRIGRHAVEFIEKHKGGGRPFFLYLAFNAVHTPLHAKTDDAARFGALPVPLNFYASMVASMDENVGRVLAALPANTLVAFTSDNGPARMPVDKWPDGWPTGVLAGSAGPLNGHKGQFLDGGIRVPFLLSWPGQLPPGGVYRQPVSTMDLYPTFCAAAGAPVPNNTRLDGVNLLPFLKRETDGSPHKILFWKNGENGAVREGDWKLLVSQRQPNLQLFNLAADIGEQHDLAGERPELVARLHKAWFDWSATLPPRANPPAEKPAAKPAQDRVTLFATKDKNRDGALSQEEFLANQADPEEAKKRFVKWDTNQDGSLSRDEFVLMGAKSN
ncbi:MAG: sulfatase [Planctomycetes bacterium]|nr:sulfatase [Planctomycetota bacterium]